MPFKQAECLVEPRGTDGNTISKDGARSNPCCACPKACMISTNSCQSVLSLEYNGKHTDLLEANAFTELFQTWNILWVAILLS